MALTEQHVNDRRWARGMGVGWLCFFTLAADGYDVGMYGTVVPSLLTYEQWNLTPAHASLYVSLTVVGMVIGSLLSGPLTGCLGIRRLIIGGTVWCALGMALTSLAPTPAVFATARGLTGLGLGLLIPLAVTLTVEYAPAHKRNFANARMFIGTSVGAVVAAAISIWVVPTFGFRGMFVVGALPVVVLGPLLYLKLPESTVWLAGRQHSAGSADAAPVAPPRPGLGAIFRGSYAPASVLFALGGFLALLITYGLQAWLPTLMQQAGYDLGSALSQLLVLNVGVVIGTLTASLLADRLGAKRAVMGAYAVIACSAGLLSVATSTPVIYLVLFSAGVGLSVQILTIGFVATYFAPRIRPTGVGWVSGVSKVGALVGPVLGGLALTAELGYYWCFAAIAAIAVVAAVFIGVIPRSPHRPADTPADVTAQAPRF